MFRMQRATVTTAAALATLVALVGCASTPATTGTPGPGDAGASAAPTGLLKKILDDGVLTVGIAANPPFSFQQTDGSFLGITPELAQGYADYLGVKMQVVPTTTASFVAGLQTGQFEVAAIALSETAERKQAIDFPDVPFYEGGNTWVVQADSPYTTVDSLNDPAVTVAFNASTFQQTATQNHLPKAQTRQLSSASYADMISEVTSGTATAISVPSLIGQTIPKKYPALRAVPADDGGVDPTPCSFGIPQNEPDFKASLDAYLQKVTDDGTLQALKDKYMTVENILP